MVDVVTAILSLGCAVLCVGVAGLLRRITDVKLHLGGYNGETRQFMIDIGRMLPASVVEQIPDPDSAAVLVIASRNCATCHQLVDELDSLPGQVLLGVMSGPGSELDVGSVALLSEEATNELVSEFDLSQIPVAIASRDGYIVGAAYGEALTAEDGLGRFWRTINNQPVEVSA